MSVLKCGTYQEICDKNDKLKDSMTLLCKECNIETSHIKIFNTFNLSTKGLPTVGQMDFKRDMISKRKKANNKHEERVRAGQGIIRIKDLQNKKKLV